MAGRVPAGLTPAAQGRRFGFTVGIAFLLLGGIVLWWRDAHRAAMVLGGLGGALVLGGLVIPQHLLGVERAWMKLAHLISKVTTPIFMGVIYFVVLTPVGVVRRAFGHNALVRRVGDAGLAPGGYWVVREPGKRQGDLSRQF